MAYPNGKFPHALMSIRLNQVDQLEITHLFHGVKCHCNGGHGANKIIMILKVFSIKLPSIIIQKLRYSDTSNQVLSLFGDLTCLFRQYTVRVLKGL